MEEGELESPGLSSHKQTSVVSDNNQVAATTTTTTTEINGNSEGITSSTRSKWESDNEQSDDQVSEKSSTYKKRKIAKNEQKRRKNRKEAVGESKSAQIEESLSQQQTQSPRHTTTTAIETNVQWRPRPQLVPPSISRCGSVDRYERLNRIDEGSYGIVYRARDRHTGEIVALKRLKCEHQDRNGFPVTDLREIHSLLWIKHENIVNVREIVVGSGAPPKVFIVMDFLEHDLKTLMSGMRSPFMQSEVKTLMLQLLSAVDTLHRNWIIHRDLKTSNLLMNNRGRVKVADFGLARKFGSPLNAMTIPVVTLWYRAPELLFGAKEYTTAIDMWSIGCIFGEMLLNEPIMPGRGEIDQLNKIFQLIGTPNEEVWPGFSKLPTAKSVNFTPQPYNMLRTKFKYVTANGIDLLSQLLTYDPAKRITAEQALQHPYFSENPPPQHPDLFPSWPSKASKERTGALVSPILIIPESSME